VLLLGGGHTHLAAVPLLAALARGRASVALLAPSRRLLYSGMMPGWLAGQYAFDDCAIDLAAVCERHGVEWIADRIVDIDFAAREAIGERGRHRFDVASINVGSANDLGEVVPAGQGGAATLRLLGAKPFAEFVEGWSAWHADCERRPGPRKMLVAGGGAAAVEIAFALAACARASPALRGSQVTLASAGRRLLPGLSPLAARAARGSLLVQGIELATGLRYVGVAGGAVRFEDAPARAADLAIVATGARPPAWLSNAARRDGVSLSREGGIAVRSDLRSTSHPAVFACGDCAGFVDQAVPRSGVHALRQGPVLAANLAAVLQAAPTIATRGTGAAGMTQPAAALARYAARRWTLALLNRCDGTAIGAWGPIGFSGRWAWRWKDRIDRRFVGSFRDPAASV
jgi:NADH dehydrogenase FAD-containing subunit